MPVTESNGVPDLRVMAHLYDGLEATTAAGEWSSDARGDSVKRLNAESSALVISAGMYGSGSTWVFNLIAMILKRGLAERRIDGVYSDRFLDKHLPAGADTIIVKTHKLPTAVRTVARVMDIPVVLTVRDPKDGAASLMKRFDMDFETALKDIRQSARALTPLADSPDVLTMRYEDRFTSKPSAIDEVAKHLGVTLARKEREAIWTALTPKAVRARIDDLASQGVFRAGSSAKTWDIATQWHPGHVGDGRVGKWRDVLSAAQATRLDEGTKAFCEAFGYATA